jgi:hypothetical protein
MQSLEQRRLLAVDATFGLGPLVNDGTVASAEVTLDFQATAGETLIFFSVDLATSSSNLIAAGPDFSAFAFAPARPLLDGWTQLGFLNDPAFESSVEFDDSLIAALPTGSYLLGTLNVDLSAVGLSAADLFTVSIMGDDTEIGVMDAQGFRFESVAFDPGARSHTPVSISGPVTAIEGEPYPLTINTEITTNAEFLVDWGDGAVDTISPGDLPSSRVVNHTYESGGEYR